MQLDDGASARAPINEHVYAYMQHACASANEIADPVAARRCEDELIKMFLQCGYNCEVAQLNLLVAGSDMPRGKILKALRAAKDRKINELQAQFAGVSPGAPRIGKGIGRI